MLPPGSPEAGTRPIDIEVGGSSPRGEMRVVAWDLPTRLFHWTLVALILSAYVSTAFAEQLGDNLLKWHRWNGLAILVLLVWRGMWGIFGSSTARFSAFLRGPRSAAAYVIGLVGGKSRRYLGHNPVGAYMVVTLLLVTGSIGVLGLFTVEHNDITAGPLYRLLSEEWVKQTSRLHRVLFDWVLLPLVGVHIAVNLLYTFAKRDPLIPAMITGRKPVADYADAREAVVVRWSLLRAAVLLAASAAIVLGTIKALGGRLP